MGGGDAGLTRGAPKSAQMRWRDWRRCVGGLGCDRFVELAKWRLTLTPARRAPRRRPSGTTPTRRGSSCTSSRPSGSARRRRARASAGTWTAAAWRAAGRPVRPRAPGRGRGPPRTPRRARPPPRRCGWRAASPGTPRRACRSCACGRRWASASWRPRRRRSRGRARAAPGTGGSPSPRTRRPPSGPRRRAPTPRPPRGRRGTSRASPPRSSGRRRRRLSIGRGRRDLWMWHTGSS